MHVPGIEIRQQPARIGLDIRKPQTRVKSRRDRLDISQQPGQLKINSKMVKVKVDNYPALYDLGYRNSKDFTEDVAGKGQETVMNGIARYSKNGDRLMDFKNNDIVDIIREETAVKQQELGLRYKRGPEIQVEQPLFNIDYQQQKPVFSSNMKTVLNRPLINAQQGQVDVKLEQYSDLEISIKGKMVDKSV